MGIQGVKVMGGVYKNSKLGYAIDKNLIKYPSSERLSTNIREYPYVFVADDGFQLKTFMLKPYAQFGA